MKKEYLLTPGPCPVPPTVGLAVARPVVHHRSGEYHALHSRVTGGLKTLFGTKGDVFILACSGTGAMESAVANTLSPGDTAVVARCGKFSGRWAEICAAYGARVVAVDAEWGEAVGAEEVAAALRKHPETAAVFAALCETSTAAKTDVAALGAVVRETPALLVVDAISALGASEFRMDEWGVDAAVAAGQKALMLPTGLSFAAVGGRKAWPRIESSKMPKYYFDWKAARGAAERDETAWSAPASLIAGLGESLDLLLHKEGLENVLARHARLGRACRAGVAALGLALVAPRAPADGLTGVRVPEGVPGDKLRELMSGRYGVRVAGGQERLKGRILRIAHMGYAGAFDVVTALAALEMALGDLGWPVAPGRGVAAAEAVLREE